MDTSVTLLLTVETSHHFLVIKVLTVWCVTSCSSPRPSVPNKTFVSWPINGEYRHLRVRHCRGLWLNPEQGLGLEWIVFGGTVSSNPRKKKSEKAFSGVCI